MFKYERQAGSALVVALIAVTAGAVLTITNMQSNFTEERVAGNYSARAKANMHAEKAASDALQVLRSAAQANPNYSFPGVNDDSVMEDAGWGSFSALNEFACGEGACKYSFYEVEAGEGNGYPVGKYIIAMGAVLSDTGQVVAESDRLYISVAGEYDVIFDGIQGALNVLGPIDRINVANNTRWLPTSANAAIEGGEFDDGNGFLYSMYYEGVAFDGNTPGGKDPFDSGLLYGGEESNAAMEWLGALYDIVKNRDPELIDGFVTDIDDLLLPGQTATEPMNLIDKDATCVNYQFAVVHDFTASGNKKFCGVLVSLGGELTLGGTAIVEGVVIAANPEGTKGNYDFTKPSQEVKLVISGGGGKGTVYFDEDVVDNAFGQLDLDYLDFFSGGSEAVVNLVDYKVVFWQ